MSGAFMTLMSTLGSGGGAALAVSIPTGQSYSANSKVHTFSTVTPTITHGVGPYTYAWSESDDGIGNWTPMGATTSTITPAVAAVTQGNTTNAYFSVKITDTGASGATATSNTALFSFTNNTPGPPP